MKIILFLNIHPNPKVIMQVKMGKNKLSTGNLRLPILARTRAPTKAEEHSVGQALEAIPFNEAASVDMSDSPGSSAGRTAPWWGRRTWQRPFPNLGCLGWWSCCQICPEPGRSFLHFERGLSFGKRKRKERGFNQWSVFVAWTLADDRYDMYGGVEGACSLCNIPTEYIAGVCLVFLRHSPSAVNLWEYWFFC